METLVIEMVLAAIVIGLVLAIGFYDAFNSRAPRRAVVNMEKVSDECTKPWGDSQVVVIGGVERMVEVVFAPKDSGALFEIRVIGGHTWNCTEVYEPAKVEKILVRMIDGSGVDGVIHNERPGQESTLKLLGFLR